MQGKHRAKLKSKREKERKKIRSSIEIERAERERRTGVKAERDGGGIFEELVAERACHAWS